VTGHGSRGSYGSWVKYSLGHIGHGSRGSWVEWVIGQVLSGSLGSWVKGHVGQLCIGSWVKYSLGDTSHVSSHVTRCRLCDAVSSSCCNWEWSDAYRSGWFGHQIADTTYKTSIVETLRYAPHAARSTAMPGADASLGIGRGSKRRPVDKLLEWERVW